MKTASTRFLAAAAALFLTTATLVPVVTVPVANDNGPVAGPVAGPIIGPALA